MDFLSYVGPGLALGLAGIGVAIGQGLVAKKALEVMGKTSAMMGFYLTIAVLGIALVESAAIYGLVVAFQLLGAESIPFWSSVGAGLAIGLAGLGAGVGQGILISGVLGAIDRNKKMKIKLMVLMVLFVALVEVTAIYGLIVAFRIISGAGLEDVHLGAGLAIGLAGLGVAIGRGYLSKKAVEVIAETPKMTNFFLTVSILGVALVESAAIYGLVISFQLLASQDLGFYYSLAAGLAIGLTGLGAGWGQGKLIVGALNAINRNPSIKIKLMTFMVLFVALVEVTAIYGLLVAFKIMGLEGVDTAYVLGAGLAIGLAGVGVGIGRGYMSETSLEVMGKNPKMISFFLTISILGVALVESAAIYALIVSFEILGNIQASWGVALAAGFAVGLAGLGVGIGQGVLVRGAIEAINQNSDLKMRYVAYMVLFVALVESVAIYGLIIAYRVLG